MGLDGVDALMLIVASTGWRAAGVAPTVSGRSVGFFGVVPLQKAAEAWPHDVVTSLTACVFRLGYGTSKNTEGASACIAAVGLGRPGMKTEEIGHESNMRTACAPACDACDALATTLSILIEAPLGRAAAAGSGLDMGGGSVVAVASGRVARRTDVRWAVLFNGSARKPRLARPCDMVDSRLSAAI